MIKKIYFWDGSLKNAPVVPRDSDGVWIMVDAEMGWSFNKGQIEYCNLKSNPKDYNVLTNQPLALDFNYVANREEQFPNVRGKIYLFSKREMRWLPIESFTDRELRFGHNLMKIWMAGEFEEEYNG